MNTINRSHGISITLPDSLRLEAAEPPAGDVRRKIPLPTGPVPLSTDQAQADSEQAALLEALRAQDFTLVDSFDLAPTPTTVDRLRRATGPVGSEAAELQVDLDANEEAVILTAQEGYYTWHFPERREEVPVVPARRGEVAVSARRATFRIETQPARVPGGGQARRGMIGDFLFERIKTFVLKFAADVIAQRGMKYLERHVHNGLVVMTPDDPKNWRRIEDLQALTLPTDRPARILLFVHGTFSSTVGSYGALGLTPWGKALLQSAQENYDVVIGYDHPTLSEDPRENATDLLARLRRLNSPQTQFDIICFSRGALVYRSLVEQLLPTSGWNAKFDRTIFTGSTNGGTRLAEPDNWHTLLDLYTNLAVGATRAIGMITHTSPAAKIVEEVIKSVGAFAKYLVTHIVAEGGVPGLAAMEPDGEFVRTINSTQPGQITPEHANYYAITSSFKARLIGGEHQPKELPLRLVLALADGFVDRLMNAINDLIVDTPSMTAIDTTVGKFIKDELNLPENPVVYHTNYFTRPEVADAIARWLHLPSPSAVIGLSRGHETPRDMVSGRRWTETGGVVKPDLPAAVNTDILVADVEDPAAETRAAVEKIAPKYVVIRREGGLYDYAFSVDEILEFSLPTQDITIDSEMDLHEHTASPTLSVSQAIDYAFDMPGPDRMVVLDEDRPVGVIRSANDLLTSDQLGDVAARNIFDISREVFFGGANDTLTGTRVIQPVSTPVKPEAESVTCHFFAEMDNEIIVNRVTTVEVIIARETVERELGPTAAGGGPGVQVETQRKLIVQVIPRAHCEVVGEDRAEVDVPTLGSPFVFTSTCAPRISVKAPYGCWSGKARCPS